MTIIHEKTCPVQGPLCECSKTLINALNQRLNESDSLINNILDKVRAEKQNRLAVEIKHLIEKLALEQCQATAQERAKFAQGLIEIQNTGQST